MTQPVKQCKWCQGDLLPKQRSYCSEKCSKSYSRDQYLLATYGISLEQWNDLLVFQGGGCAVCGRAPTGRRVLVVDHEHTGGPAGKVRGLLCSIPCNLKLVAKHKDGKQLRAAADYLSDPPAVRLWGEVVAPGRPKRTRKPRRKR